MGNGADFGEFHLHLFYLFSISNQLQINFNQVGLTPIVTRMVAQTITQINENFHLSYHFAVLQKRFRHYMF